MCAQVVTECGKGIGLVNGRIVTVLGNWMDGKRQLHYRVRLPGGEINNDVHQDDISFDPKLIRARSH